MVWYGLALGAVIGGEGSDKNSYDGGLGGAKNANNDSDSDNGGQGLFSLFGHQTWLYIGEIMGFGDAAGIYLTTGPMIGADCDWAIGGGIHIAKAFGLGLVVPIRQALTVAAAKSEEISQLLGQGQEYLTAVTDVITHAGASSLEMIASNPVYAAASILALGTIASTHDLSLQNIGHKVKDMYQNTKEKIIKNIHYL